MWRNSISSKHAISAKILSWYFYIVSSLASNSPVAYPTTSWESNLICSHLAPAAFTNHIAARAASYSAALLDARKVKRRACSVDSLSGESNTTPAQFPASQEDRSTNATQGSGLVRVGGSSSVGGGMV